MGHTNSLYALFEHRWSSQGSNPQLHLTLHADPVCSAPARGPHPRSACWPYLHFTNMGPTSPVSSLHAGPSCSAPAQGPHSHSATLALSAAHQHGAHIPTLHASPVFSALAWAHTPSFISSCWPYLQCTSTGPMSGTRAADDLRTKVRTGRVYSGTPMSGHCV